MGVIQGILEIHRRKQDEYEGLQKGNKNTQPHEGQGDPNGNQSEECRHHFMIPGHVTEQSNCK